MLGYARMLYLGALLIKNLKIKNGKLNWKTQAWIALHTLTPPLKDALPPLPPKPINQSANQQGQSSILHHQT